MYSTNAIAISSLAEVNALALMMGIAFFGGQSRDITSPPDNPDTNINCITLTSYELIQAVNNVNSCNICTQYATNTDSFLAN